MMVNIILIILIIFTISAGLVFAFRARPDEEYEEDIIYDIPNMVGFVKNVVMNELSSKSFSSDSERSIRLENRRKELRIALKRCMHGSISDKMFVKSYIKDILHKVYKFNDENVNAVIPFNSPDKLSAEDKFNIMLYYYKKKFGYDALTKLIVEHNWNTLKESPDRGIGYRVTALDVDNAFEKEQIELSLDDKIEIITQKVYQRYKGLGVIDEIRDMNVDGVSAGVNGIPEDISVTLDFDDYFVEHIPVVRSHESVWIFFRGIPIRFEFLGFENYLELRRVCQNLYTYGSPGQLTEVNGHKINELADGSRIVVLAPKLTESWCFFVRKFNSNLEDISNLITEENDELPIGALEFMAKGARTVGLTGQQGTGKTTLLKAAFKFFYSWWNVRVQEGTSFELGLRRAYPYANVISFRETSEVSGEEGLVIQKKTDGTVNLIGEAAEDRVMSFIMKTAQVASSHTWFTHHANTAKGLIDAFRDALVSTGFFTSETLAEAYVCRVLKYNVHLRNRQGKRYIERITEYIPIEKNPNYPTDYRNETTINGILSKFFDTATEFFYRLTDRELYTVQNIVEYRDGKYVAVNPPTKQNIEEMLDHMTPDDAQRFKEFLNKHWGVVV